MTPNGILSEESSFSGPIIHLVRHAESEHKPNNGTRRVLEHIFDPRLTSRGRKHCNRRNDFLRPQAKYITHILASPLLRGLETAILSLKAVTDRGVKVCAVPELQSISCEPAGIGMSLVDLRSRYELNNAGEKVSPVEEYESKKGNKEKVLSNEKFRGKLDFRYMSADWNDVQCKKEGRWSWKNQDWRRGYLKGFLRALCSGTERVEIVVVCHSSSMRYLVKDVILNGDEWNFSSYIFDNFGNLCPITALEVARLRERSEAEDEGQTLIDKKLQLRQAPGYSNINLEVKSQEMEPLPVIPAPVVEIPVKNTSQKPSLRIQQVLDLMTNVPSTKCEDFLPFIKEKSDGESPQKFPLKDLDEKSAIKAPRTQTNSKIQRNSNTVRGIKTLGKVRIQKKATGTRKTQVQGKHHMILRNRV